MQSRKEEGCGQHPGVGGDTVCLRNWGLEPREKGRKWNQSGWDAGLPDQAGAS